MIADLIVDGVRVRASPHGELAPGPIAIAGGRVAAIGPTAAGLRATRRIWVDGGVAIPGLVDSHTHAGWAGAALWRAGWAGLRPESWLDELARAAALVTAPHWVLGGGWDAAELPESALPPQPALDQATGRLPCLLTSADGSLAICNSAAADLMRLADLPPVPGGEIVRGATGQPTGVLRGAAARAQPTAGVVPPPGRLRRAAELSSALDLLAGRGVTEIHDIATWPADPGLHPTFVERSFTDVTAFEALAAAGRLPVRVGVRPFLGRWAEFTGGWPVRRSALITVTGLKLFVGGHGYTAPDGSQVLVSPSFRDPGPAVATEWVRAAHNAGIGCSLHAIGDGDVHVALDVFQRALGGGSAGRVRHRLVHLRSVRPRDALRLAALGIAAEIQPFDVLQDLSRLRRHLPPDAIARLAPYRELADAGVPVLLGSDWRAAGDLRAADPLVGMAAAVLRRLPGATEEPLPGPGLTPAQALYAATLAPVVAAGADADGSGPDRGTLRAGLAADIAVLSEDPLGCPPDRWPALERLVTVCAGQVTHCSAVLQD